MYFVVNAMDAPGMAERRVELRPKHRARLREHAHPVKVHVAGALLDAQGNMVGSMLLIEAEDAAAVQAYVAEDPYVLNGVYARTDVTAFAWAIGAPAAG